MTRTAAGYFLLRPPDTKVRAEREVGSPEFEQRHAEGPKPPHKAEGADAKIANGCPRG